MLVFPFKYVISSGKEIFVTFKKISILKQGLLIVFYLIGFQIFSQSDLSFVKLKREIQKVENTLLVDFNRASLLLDSLDRMYIDNYDPRASFHLTLLKIRFNNSYGNFPRVKFEINKAHELLYYFKPAEQEKLYINFYTILYEYKYKDLNKVIKMCENTLLNADPSDNNLQIMVNVIAARANLAKGNYKKSIQLIGKARDIATKFGVPEQLFFVNNSEGQIHYEYGASEKAIAVFSKLKKEAIQQNWLFVEQYMNLCIGLVYLKDDNLSKAKSYFDIVLKNTDKTEKRDLFQLYSAYEYYFNKKGDFNSAYQFLLKQYQIDDELEEFKAESINHELEREFKKESAQFQLRLEKEKNKELETILVISGIAAFFILLLAILFILHKSKVTRILKIQKAEIDLKNQQILNSLNFKENMIKEIHHRVKNNLQIISSIINLQRKNLEDEKLEQVLNEVNAKIQAIALIHNQLHLGGNSTFVQANTYLKLLTDQIANSFDGYRTKINLLLDVDEINITIDQAIPLSLIVSELVSNSLKHAFKGFEQGTIEIKFKQLHSNDEVYQLSVKDNGVGVPNPNKLLEHSSTGVEIIAAFIQQLDAQVKIVSEGGLGVYLTFKVLKF